MQPEALTPVQVDSLTLAAVRWELLADLPGARVARVDQPHRRRVFIEFERQRRRPGLLIVADPQLARLHLTARRPARPPVQPGFLQLLRKYLEGCRLVDITQPNWDRLLHLHFEGYSAIGKPLQLVLAAEIMGKFSNIILFRPDDGIILGCLQVVDESLSDRRWIAPGERYTLPVTGSRPQWHTLAAGRIQETLRDLPARERSVQRLSERIGGLSRAGWTYVLALAGPAPDDERVARALEGLKAIGERGQFVPHQTDAGYSVLPPLAGAVKPLSVSVLLEGYYSEVERRLAVERLQRELGATLDRALARCRRKLVLHEQQVAGAPQAEGLRHLGDLVMANIHRVQPGQESIAVEDYAAPDGKSVTIPLDPRLSPAASAQAYYKRYRKIIQAAREGEKLLAECRRDLAYLEQARLGVDLAESPEELEETAEELTREGIVKERRPGGQGKRKAPTAEDLLPFRSSAGLTILAGKNNRQNDFLTLKLAHPRDIWVHTRIIPGAHVVIRTEGGRRPLTEATVAEAAQIAAYYSKARLSSNVPVVYTECRFVSKPKGAKPGMVIYEQEKTLFVTPEAAIVSGLIAGPGGS